jgi:uncharacterized membrane protein
MAAPILKKTQVIMQKKLTWTDMLALLIWLLPLIYLIYVYPSLADTIPLHFDGAGNPDRFGPKTKFAGMVLLVNGIGLLAGLLVRFLPSIDPKKKARYSQTIFIRVSHAVLFLIAALNFLIIYAGTQQHFTMPVHVFYPLMGLFLAYLGNLLNNVKPNYFVGIRTPWTLENEEVWRKTHRLAAKLWLPGGIVMAILGWAIRGQAGHFVFTGGVLLLALIPVVYSYIYYRELSK